MTVKFYEAHQLHYTCDLKIRRSQHKSVKTVNFNKGTNKI